MNEKVLTEEQIHTFLQDGVLVVDEILTDDGLKAAWDGLRHTLGRHGIDTEDLASTGHNLSKLTSTNGSGGVLDLFYDEWKIRIVATNAKLFHATTELWEAAYVHDGETSKEDLGEEEEFKWHPNGSFDPQKGFCYIDRIGFRIPTKLAEQLGAELNGHNQKSTASKKKKTPLQRSLTPHLDCCPDNLYNNKTKWRPIQCFVSLTDNLHANEGGFEAAKGFHRSFQRWAKNRSPTTIRKKMKNGAYKEVSFPAPCIGEYTHIRPTEDRDVMEQIQHIPGVKAGSAVFWDHRIPHANAYRHNGYNARCVVYCSFLPADIAINRTYVARQLENWKQGRQPTDPWMNIKKKNATSEEAATTTSNNERQLEEESTDSLQEFFRSLTPLQRRLLGIDSW